MVETMPRNTFKHDRPTKAELGTLKKKLAGYISGVTAQLQVQTQEISQLQVQAHVSQGKLDAPEHQNQTCRGSNSYAVLSAYFLFVLVPERVICSRAIQTISTGSTVSHELFQTLTRRAGAARRGTERCAPTRTRPARTRRR